MKKVKISREAYSIDSSVYWNSFNDVLSSSEVSYERGLGLIADCQIIYWYASFLANGGVYYALDIIPQGSYEPLKSALIKHGAVEHAEIVGSMIELYLKNEELMENNQESEEIDHSIKSIEDLSLACQVDLFQLLERIQVENEDQLVEWCK